MIVFEDENADLTLRDGGEDVNKILESELSARLSKAGVCCRRG
ncbi:Uncharacterised protein [Sphingobacterium daejeonense]|nr:Uncharacterised protein [Sphingobacterium daejeonense]